MNLVTGELAAMEKLRAPFPASETGQLPRGGTTLAYVGHAAITGRLLDVDPAWNWEPVAVDEDGLPIFLLEGGKPVGFWIRLTVCGVTRLGYGSCPPNQFDAVKVLVGDALRNAAMRFGVALDLWVKGSPELPQEEEARPSYLSGLTVKTFLDKCAASHLSRGAIDAIVIRATAGRTNEATGVYAEELDALREAFDSLVVVAEPALSTPPGEDKVKPGKSVPKRVVQPVDGIEDVHTDGTLV